MWQQLWQWFREPENQRLCLGVIAGLVAGWVVGRLAARSKAKEAKSLAKDGDKAFFKGIQYILSNDHDQAIEEFTKSVQINSDTIETYVALGNLYRSKGDIDRAIRVRQSIILRPHMDEQLKLRALFDLGLDYRKGGFLNRALETFLSVLQRMPTHLETLREVEKIYEEMKDWASAFATRQRITRLVKGDHAHILAHHQTEMGKAFLEKGEVSKAKSCFKSALSIDETCLDAYLHLGDLHFARQDYKQAIATWKKVVNVSPRFTFLAYRRLEGAYAQMKNLKPVSDFLKECAQLTSDPFTHMALARYLYNEKDYQGALRELRNALDLDPTFWEARKLMGEIHIAQGMNAEALEAYRDVLSHLNVPYLKFQCRNCGFRPVDLQWQCPQCRQWDTTDMMESGAVDSTSLREPPGDIHEPSRQREIREGEG
ncbi:MAG: tetratricopeptide repeat protein [Deltaproteobacteria bacterium]|nr:tetratricopeptide repeat protein [Deltaproteobacteria bacterium]